MVISEIDLNFMCAFVQSSSQSYKYGHRVNLFLFTENNLYTLALKVNACEDLPVRSCDVIYGCAVVIWGPWLIMKSCLLILLNVSYLSMSFPYLSIFGFTQTTMLPCFCSVRTRSYTCVVHLGYFPFLTLIVCSLVFLHK